MWNSPKMVVHKQRDMISVIKNSVTVEIVFGNWSWEELLKKRKKTKKPQQTMTFKKKKNHYVDADFRQK